MKVSRWSPLKAKRHDNTSSVSHSDFSLLDTEHLFGSYNSRNTGVSLASSGRI